MKLYIIRNNIGSFIEMVIFKNTIKLDCITLQSILTMNGYPTEEEFVNTSYFFTKDKKKALMVKSHEIAIQIAKQLNGYIVEVDV
jgi:hypothetical protein